MLTNYMINALLNRDAIVFTADITDYYILY